MLDEVCLERDRWPSEYSTGSCSKTALPACVPFLYGSKDIEAKFVRTCVMGCRRAYLINLPTRSATNENRECSLYILSFQAIFKSAVSIKAVHLRQNVAFP